MHYINEQNGEERRKILEIYILRQVNTLDKGFKLSYAVRTIQCKRHYFSFRVVACDDNILLDKKTPISTPKPLKCDDSVFIIIIYLLKNDNAVCSM